MFEKSCACKKSKKSFRLDIGPFFVAECCIEEGFDEVGNLKVPKQIGITPEEVETLSESLKVKELVVVDEGELPDPNEELEPLEPVKEVKPKRTYNKSGNIKKES